MRKAAVIYLVALLVPSFVLAGLAWRSLKNQELVIERQRGQLFEVAAQSVVKDIAEAFANEELAFANAVEKLMAKGDPAKVAENFDPLIPKFYTNAYVGFAVSLVDGQMFSPSLLARPEARRFRLENELFLTSKETAQVYWNGPKGPINLSALDQSASSVNRSANAPRSAGTEFRRIIGTDRQGILARYVQDELSLMAWYRSTRDEDIVFGVELNLPLFLEKLRTLLRVDAALQPQIVLTLMDDKNSVAALSDGSFAPHSQRPFTTAEIGDYLPHWKVGVLLRNPAKIRDAASSANLILGLLICVLVVAIAVGGWLIVSDMNRGLRLARQRTDFVSNVSHELKTPLTSIRMFSEMLAEGKVSDPARQRTFCGIIAAETARLTRLINNVLDFARMERGEKHYDLVSCDLSAITRRTVEDYRPHLESNGFTVEMIADGAVFVSAEKDAITQIVLNLVSNAEKYSGETKMVRVEVASTNGFAEVQVLDRGRGVPPGLDEKIFEQFYRAHDSLSEGIQGAGLGLTLSRQMARAHGGDILFERRPEGGSCFLLRLPLNPCTERV